MPSRSRSEQAEWELVKETGFTPVPNLVVKALMREATKKGKLSIVLVGLAIMQESIGWRNPDGEGRQLLAHISLSRFEELTGLTRPTIVASLRDLEEIPMFRRIPSDNRQWSGWQHGLDFEWLTRQAEETERLNEFTTDAEMVVNSVDQGSKATLPAGSEESLPELVNSVDPTKKVPKERMKERSERSNCLSDQICQKWPAVLEELQGQTTAATFSTYLKNLTPLPGKNGEIVLESRNKYDASWVSLSLDRVVLRGLQAVEPTVGSAQVMIAAPDGTLFPLGRAAITAGNWEPWDGERAARGSVTEGAVIQNPMEQLSGV